MHDDELGNTLAGLERIDPEVSVAAARAKERMLAAFDDVNATASLNASDRPGDGGEDAGEQPLLRAAELAILAEAGVAGHQRGRSRRALLSAAAALLLIVALVGTQIVNRASTPDTASNAELANNATAENAGGDDEGDVPEAALAADDDLPRLIDGRFTTPVFVCTAWFVTDVPMWLTRHEPGLI